MCFGTRFKKVGMLRLRGFGILCLLASVTLSYGFATGSVPRTLEPNIRSNPKNEYSKRVNQYGNGRNFAARCSPMMSLWNEEFQRRVLGGPLSELIPAATNRAEYPFDFHRLATELPGDCEEREILVLDHRCLDQSVLEQVHAYVTAKHWLGAFGQFFVFLSRSRRHLYGKCAAANSRTFTRDYHCFQ